MRLVAAAAGVLVLILLLGCGGKETAEANDAKSETPDPCALLSEEVLRKHIAIGEVEITRRLSEHSPHPLCIVSWPRPDAAELLAEYQKQMMAYAQAKAKGEDVEMPKVPGDREITLTIYNERFDSPAEARSALDSAVEMIEKGVTSKKDPSVKVLGHGTEPVEGVGDKAAWVPAMSQLSVANGRRVFHLSVRVSDDPGENRAKAAELAGLLTADIR